MTKILFGILLGVVSVFVYQFHPEVVEPILSASRQITDELVSSKPIEPQQKQENGTENRTASLEVPQSVPKALPKEMDDEKAISEKTSRSEVNVEISYPLWRFDTKKAAERFAESIEKRSGIALKIGPESAGYMTYILDANEEGVLAKLKRIKDTSGIILSRRETNGENEKP